MLKNIIFPALIVALLVSCGDRMAYRVKVNLSNLPEQTVYAVFEASDMKIIDTLAYSGQGEFTLNQQSEGFNSMTLYYNDYSSWITVWLEPYAKMSVTGDARYPELAEIRGGEINETLTQFSHDAATLLKESAEFAMRNDERTFSNGDEQRLFNLGNELRRRAEQFIRKHPDKRGSAVILKKYFSDTESLQLTDTLLSVLDPRLSDFFVVREMKSFVEKAKKTETGAQAPDFTVRDIFGKTYNTSSLSRRYTILAFVSMWGDLCHTKDLFLDETVNVFPRDSVNVLLFCLDENSAEIRSAVSADPIRWNVVTDSAGQTIEMIDTYNVGSIPLCYLIDKEGKIVLKTDNGIELRQKLGELLPAKE
ncbi:MAG: redoxin domain-containing protein [Tannerella sp.]|jgi:peroxiredoxin|nr:redoxin domain-containing protein [Tannerella sp.]